VAEHAVKCNVDKESDTVW